MAMISASRVMKSICWARMPNSMLRSLAEFVMAVTPRPRISAVFLGVRAHQPPGALRLSWGVGLIVMQLEESRQLINAQNAVKARHGQTAVVGMNGEITRVGRHGDVVDRVDFGG